MLSTLFHPVLFSAVLSSPQSIPFSPLSFSLQVLLNHSHEYCFHQFLFLSLKHLQSWLLPIIIVITSFLSDPLLDNSDPFSPTHSFYVNHFLLSNFHGSFCLLSHSKTKFQFSCIYLSNIHTITTQTYSDPLLKFFPLPR